MGKKAKIGLIQVDHHNTHHLEARWDMLYRLGEECLDNGADLVFFPEAFQYTDDRSVIKHPDELYDLSMKWKECCAGLASKYKAYVAPWDYEVNGKNIYNSSYILDRNGNEAGRFRKVHLTYGEQMWGLACGDDFPVFDLDIGKVGIMICFDNYWPESARVLALRGAQLILYPLYGDTLAPQWEIKMRSRAIDNFVYIASCQIDNIYNIAYTGLVNQEGDVVARLDSAPSWKVAEVDMDREVVTSTGGDKRFDENLMRYLERCRNVKAYDELLKERKDLWTWEDVFHGKLP